MINDKMNFQRENCGSYYCNFDYKVYIGGGRAIVHENKNKNNPNVKANYLDAFKSVEYFDCIKQKFIYDPTAIPLLSVLYII